MLRFAVWAGLGYAAIGLILGLVMVESYDWGVTLSECDTMLEKDIARIKASVAGYWEGFLRFLFWAPSLLFWAVAGDTGLSLWDWMAPGLSKGCGSAAA